jgi:DNA-directed RNA polymerase subunit RPC12/RpoP
MNRITYPMTKAVRNKLINAGREVLCFNCRSKALFTVSQMVDAAIKREERTLTLGDDGMTYLMEVLNKVNDLIARGGSIRDIRYEIGFLDYKPLEIAIKEILDTITFFDVDDMVYSKPGQGKSGGKKVFYCMSCAKELNLM